MQRLPFIGQFSANSGALQRGDYIASHPCYTMTYIIYLRQKRTCRFRRHATAIAQGFVYAASGALGGKSAQTMLTASIHVAYEQGARGRQSAGIVAAQERRTRARIKPDAQMQISGHLLTSAADFLCAAP
ncbi:hypothetical protein [Paraburkholderia eburnea]|uniref:hypothetical protein n=1 Tax=Paraburkholderia eburnea TaxID=1189126 RepID=UPI0011B00B81|nr:hypothetical protein [Paraburkholderia eburnea]